MHLVLFLLTCFCMVASSAMAAQTSNILMVFSNNRLLPANIEVDRGFREAISNAPDREVELFSEFLDRPTFSGKEYEQTVATYLHDKYATRPPAVVVVAGQPALDFLLRHRSELFPEVPVVHLAVDKSLLQSDQPLPADVVGVPVTYDYSGTIQQALRWHPDARRLIVVTGSSSTDRAWESQARSELSRLKLPIAVEFMAGMSTDTVVKRLRELSSDDIVFTPGYFRDGADHAFAPRESAKIIAAASKAPVYGPFSTFIGSGVVGGRVPTYSEMGRQAAKSVNSLLDGVPPAALKLPEGVPTELQIDWRQAEKWGIAADAIPLGAVVHFREPTFWERYQRQVIVAAIVFLFQAALIVALLIERARRQRTALALEQSESRMNLAAYAARLSMWMWDLTHDKIWATSKLRQNAGLSKETPTSFDQILKGVHPADRDGFDRAVRRAAAKDEELDVEYRVIQPDGDVRWFAARGHSAKGDGQRLMGVKMDITARKVAELQAAEAHRSLTHASRLAAVGELTAMVAHEINQPLGAILSNADAAELLLDSSDPPLAEIREILQHIRKSDVRASEAILRLRALLSKQEMRLLPIDLNSVIVEVLRLTAADLSGRQIAVREELSPSLPPVSGDPVHLQQVLLNLVVNAMDAMKDTPVEDRLLTVRTCLDGHGTVEVAVTDRGHGIAAETLSGIFDSFVTTKSDGMGLGLSIVRSIVKSHEGRIWAENLPGGGAVFRFTLKLAAKETG